MVGEFAVEIGFVPIIDPTLYADCEICRGWTVPTVMHDLEFRIGYQEGSVGSYR